MHYPDQLTVPFFVLASNVAFTPPANARLQTPVAESSTALPSGLPSFRSNRSSQPLQSRNIPGSRAMRNSATSASLQVRKDRPSARFWPGSTLSSLGLEKSFEPPMIRSADRQLPLFSPIFLDFFPFSPGLLVVFSGFLASRRRKWAKNGGKWVKNG